MVMLSFVARCSPGIAGAVHGLLAGVYFLLGFNGEGDPFSAGIGLKTAALISFGVSFVAILIMAVVSGGDAILGELPFTIAGFLIFFVIFWLMIAWIF